MTMQFTVGRRVVTITIPPFVLLLLLLSGAAGYTLAACQYLRTTTVQQAELAHLRERTQELENEVLQERGERRRVNAVAEARARELWEELEVRRAEVNQLWQQVNPHHRRPLASRGGRRHFSDLQTQMAIHRVEVTRLKAAARSYRIRLTPMGAPCAGDMTSPFGPRLHPIYGVGRPHNGMDFTTDYGTAIRATADGKVVRSEWYGGYGQVVEIEHGFGLRTLYAHCSELKVSKGARVRRGQVIATVGATGLASGPHCHYEVHRDGKPIDPAEFVALRPPQEAAPAFADGSRDLTGVLLQLVQDVFGA